MYEVQRMKKATLTGCHSKLSGATILGGLLCKSSIYLLNTTCSCGDLNAAIRFGSRLTGAKINIIYEPSCKQAVNKLCSHGSLQVVKQVWDKLLTTCNNLVDIIRLVTRLFQQGCYNHDATILLQPCVVNLVTFLLYHDCIRLVRTTL